MKDESQKVGDFFEGYAGQFDEIYMIQIRKGFWGWLSRRLRASMLIRYEKTFTALQPMVNRTVLDIGCGSGRYLLKCLELGAAKVTGIDLSEEMLSLSRKALDNTGDFNNRAELISGDFLKYDFKVQYEYAIAMGLMDYIENPEEFMTKLYNTITEKAVLSFPIAESFWTLQRNVRYKLRGCPLYFYKRKQLEKLMKSSEFKSYSIEQIERDYFVVVQK